MLRAGNVDTLRWQSRSCRLSSLVLGHPASYDFRRCRSAIKDGADTARLGRNKFLPLCRPAASGHRDVTTIGDDDPESIHLNSFMYEPILDMSEDQLRRLYDDMTGL